MTRITILALACSAGLFAAHAFPLNSKVIEKGMVGKIEKLESPIFWYVVGYFYYALWMFAVIYGAEYLIKRSSKK